MTRHAEPARFLASAVAHKGSDCLIWPYADNGRGYGKIYLDGRMQYAHREVCRLARGEPPTPDHEAAHSCGNGDKGCVNPAHLSWKSHAENMQDMPRHGRAALAKLTPELVVEIRSLYGTESIAAIASRYNVCRQTVHHIGKRQTWAWL